ncbi:MAG: hypothetical protein ACE14L_04820 [Terriglobales bacterium]
MSAQARDNAGNFHSGGFTDNHIWFEHSAPTGTVRMLDIGDADNCIVQGNVLQGVATGANAVGIKIFTAASNTNNILLDGNIIKFNTTAGSGAPKGIVVDPGAAHDLKNLKITDNTIECNSVAGSVGLSLAQTAGTLDHVTIEGNHILNCGGTGLTIAAGPTNVKVGFNDYVNNATDYADSATSFFDDVIGKNFTFATLPAAANGSRVYCSDCNATCTAGGATGRTCFRENGAWIH